MPTSRNPTLFDQALATEPTTQASRRKRGRPERTFVDRARDICWARFIQERSGAAKSGSPNRIKSALEAASPWRQQPEGFPTSSVFYKYLRGEAGPSRDVVVAIGGHVAGGVALFDHPLWALASADSVPSHRLAEMLRRLQPGYTRELLGTDDSNRVFWRRPGADIDTLLDAAVKQPMLDSAALVLAIVQDSVLRQDERGHLAAWKAWARLGQGAPGNRLPGLLFPHFFALVARQATQRRYLDTRLDAELLQMLEIAHQDEQRFRAARSGISRELRAILDNRVIGEVGIADLSFLKQLISPGPLLKGLSTVPGDEKE